MSPWAWCTRAKCTREMDGCSSTKSTTAAFLLCEFNRLKMQNDRTQTNNMVAHQLSDGRRHQHPCEPPETGLYELLRPCKKLQIYSYITAQKRLTIPDTWKKEIALEASLGSQGSQFWGRRGGDHSRLRPWGAQTDRTGCLAFAHSFICEAFCQSAAASAWNTACIPRKTCETLEKNASLFNWIQYQCFFRMCVFRVVLK